MSKVSNPIEKKALEAFSNQLSRQNRALSPDGLYKGVGLKIKVATLNNQKCLEILDVLSPEFERFSDQNGKIKQYSLKGKYITEITVEAKDGAKKVIKIIKLQIPAGKANPAPPIGPALGQAGLNIMEFCKQFNAATQKTEAGTPIPVVITAYKDRSFTFIMKQPPVSYFLLKAAKIEKGTGTTGKEIVGKVTKKQIEEIAKVKMVDMNAHDVEAACRMIAGSAVSMGIQVVEAA